MSEGYTQVAVVQYRHCTTSCHDYRVCCEFQQSVAVGMITRTEMGGGHTTKHYRNTVWMMCVYVALSQVNTVWPLLPCGLWPALHILTEAPESGRDSIMSH